MSVTDTKQETVSVDREAVIDALAHLEAAENVFVALNGSRDSGLYETFMPFRPKKSALRASTSSGFRISEIVGSAAPAKPTLPAFLQGIAEEALPCASVGVLGTGAVKRLLVVVTVAAALVVPTAAPAAPPALVRVGHVKQRPTASWRLPAGVESQLIEFATDPALATDGSFVFENIVLEDLVEAGQTSYTSSERQLTTGVTYYVHVSGIDWPCFYVFACPVREWSNVLTLRIPNVAPVLQSTRWSSSRVRRSGSARLQVCDDEGDFRVIVGQQRLRRGKVIARATTVVGDDLRSSGCGSLSVTWSIPPKLIAIGDLYRVTFTVVDAGGRRSRSISGQSRWRG